MLMSDFLVSILTPLNNFVWGPVMLVLIVGTGLYLNIMLKFYPFRNWKKAYMCLWEGRKHKGEGEISPWNALMTAIAADVGTGNIVGVATAIAIGGPGALFWMWMTALVGMMTKFCEVMLSVLYREKTPAGNYVGGCMYFIKNGLGPRWKWLGTLFAIFGIIAAIMGIGGMVQANAIAVNVKSTFGISEWAVAGALLVISLGVLIGGVQRVGVVAGKLVPLMALFYVVLSLVIILSNIERVPGIFLWVVKDAFTPTAAQGGFAGATIMMAIRMGVARGVFSNEAGLGTAPMVHAASSAESPLVQASIGMLDVFIDTLIVCSMTGFVILIAVVPPDVPAVVLASNPGAQPGDPLWSCGMNGGLLSALAFLAVVCLENLVFARLPVMGVIPVMAPMAVVMVGVFEGPSAGAIFGVAAGVFCDSLYLTGGSMTLACTLMGLGSGLVSQYAFSASLIGCCICSAVSLVALDGVRVLFYLLRGEALEGLLRIAVPEVIYSLVLTLPIYLIIRTVYRRVGGEKLA